MSKKKEATAATCETHGLEPILPVRDKDEKIPGRLLSLALRLQRKLDDQEPSRRSNG